jgi:hypothetical protein
MKKLAYKLSLSYMFPVDITRVSDQITVTAKYKTQHNN